MDSRDPPPTKWTSPLNYGVELNGPFPECDLQGEHLFNKKLIPHIFMSKEQLPRTVTCDQVLSTIFTFIEDWKRKLYELMSVKTQSPRVKKEASRSPSPIRHSRQGSYYIKTRGSVDMTAEMRLID